MITLGHLSDPHCSDPSDATRRELLNKRFLGWLSWRINRRHHYKRSVLDALIEDLRAQAPGHVVLTGDLTNIGLEKEFEVARRVLDRLGAPEDVSLIPGNHDCYVGAPLARSYARWAEFLASDEGVEPDPIRCGARDRGRGARAEMFAYRDAGPSLRVRGAVAIVGVCSAIPTAPLLASGAVGREQLERLERMLTHLGERGMCRVVLVHHPVLPEDDSFRRGLRDVREFRAVLQRAGAELVLHGHDHQTRVGSLPGPARPVPVVGVRSASYTGEATEKTAHYHLYDIEQEKEGEGEGAGRSSRWRIVMRARGWEEESSAFTDVGSVRVLGDAAVSDAARGRGQGR